MAVGEFQICYIINAIVNHFLSISRAVFFDNRALPEHQLNSEFVQYPSTDIHTHESRVGSQGLISPPSYRMLDIRILDELQRLMEHEMS